MDYLPQGETFAVGEVVLTSGLGGRFPKGIPIGQVVEIRQRDIDVFQQAVVRPTVDLPRLELVMVVTNFDPLEDVPELLVPEAVPASEEEVNPLDAEAPIDAAPVDAAPVDVNGLNGDAPNVPASDTSVEPAQEIENGQ
jgi:rod shape-determining protein MreC